MNYRFNLPRRLYISLTGVLLAIIYVRTQVNDEYFKFVINYIGAIFFGLCIISALTLRNNLSELPKNILNAIWNIETAFVFIYVISLTYCHFIYGEAPSKNFTTWAEQHPVLFISLTHSLGFVALARAATAFTDIFKKPIMKLHETTADPIGDWIRNNRNTNN